MRPYELMTILAPDVPEDELTPAIDNIASYITRFGGSITAVIRDSPWGRRRLSYPIRYQSRDVRDGFYVLWYFESEPETIAEIDREIRLNDIIIRHLTIALDKPFVPAPPAPVEAPAEGDSETTAPAVESSEADAEVEAPAAEAETDAPVAEAEAEVAVETEAPVAEAEAEVVAETEAPIAEAEEEVAATTEAPVAEAEEEIAAAAEAPAEVEEVAEEAPAAKAAAETAE